MEDRHQLYQDFLQTFPIEHLADMTLEEYTNLDRNNSFCYWIETRLEQLGSIWGGSSYKFGIFKYQNVPVENTKFQHDDKYAWYARYNAQTAEDAFLIVRDAVVRIANSARDGNYEVIDEITELGDGYKWKIAFLYSDESLMPIYKKEWLIDSCTRLGMENAKKAKIAELQRYLMERKGDKPLYDYYEELGDYLWKNTAQRVWIYSPGENARKWDFCTEHSVMCLGWDELGDYMQYASREDIVKQMQVIYDKPNSSCKNDSLAVWEFSRVMKEGDIIIVKEGQKKIVGRGVVESEYFLDESLEEYPNCRKVRWTAVGEWEAPHASVQKTLTDITKYPDYINELNQLFDETMTNKAKQHVDVEHYVNLLTRNHNIVLTGAPGTGKTYLSQQIAQAMGAEWERVQFHPSYDYTDFVEGLKPTRENSFSRKDGVFKAFCKRALLQQTVKSAASEVLAQGTSFDEAYDILVDDIRAHKAVLYSDFRRNKTQLKVRVSSDAEGEGKARLEYWAGKDYRNAQIEYLVKLYNHYRSQNIFDVRNERFDDFVQIIGNTLDYSYYRGIVQGLLDRTKRENVADACPVQEAESGTNDVFVFIIDEINRGEISKIFGELFFSIDAGYRGEKGRVCTQYQNLVDEDDEFYDGFFVPENVYIIGTMNDIDRSVESMDFAIRRRFTWVEVTAEESAGNMGLPQEKAKKMKRLNDVIKDMEELGEAYQLGAAYFLGDESDEERWKYRILPLLKEYLRGTADSEAYLKTLEKAYNEEAVNDEGEGQQ